VRALRLHGGLHALPQIFRQHLRPRRNRGRGRTDSGRASLTLRQCPAALFLAHLVTPLSGQRAGEREPHITQQHTIMEPFKPERKM
jgi:hypothetical protein